MNGAIIKNIHFYFGITVIVIFTLTGQYMHHFYDHLKNMEPAPRMIFRAGHIYILFSGLINVTLGGYFTLNEKKGNQILQLIGSVLIIVAPMLFIGSFFIELPTDQLERLMARFGIYFIAAGTVIHGLTRLMFASHKK
ncbi:hypothetical protein QQ008_00530 [Fulvivirgaceae bacterium BMA10]|uniref:Uncharacterized protein n=1 Tax=Splendidivirga corallicola TaxID=3051826 RepID=A0ABT8KHU5_9BACT|nr:hypothetical protein [Fulvivirgaceae bacterium BMA10]